MNQGTLRGVASGLNGTTIINGGGWAGNRGRLCVDEIRLWGMKNDSERGAHNAARYVPFTAQQHVATIAYPGDLGNVVNVGTGNFLAVGPPYSSAFGTSGRFLFSQNSTAQSATLQNNTTFQNLPNVACTIPAGLTAVGGTTHIADGAAVTAGPASFADFGSQLIFSVVNGGTLAVGTVYNFQAHVFINPGVTTTQRSGFRCDEDTTSGTLTTQVGFDVPIMVGATHNYQMAIGLNQTVTISASVGGALIEIGPGGTFTCDFVTATFPSTLRMSTATVLFNQAAAVVATTFANHSGTYRNVSTAAISMPAIIGYQSSPTIGPDTQTGRAGATSTDFRSAPTYSNLNSGTVTSAWAHVGYASTFTLNATGSTVLIRTAYQVSNATLTNGTLTTQIGLDIAALSGAGSNIGIRLGDGGTDIATGTSTGSMFGMTTSQKIGFLGATPIIQQANSVDIAAVLTNFGFRASGGNPPLNLGTGALTAGSTALGATTTTSLAATLAVTSSGATNGIGYATGAGGAVTQLTSKTTAFPTISKVCGTLTWNGAALAASTSVTSGSSTNTAIAATDTVVFNHISGGTLGAYTMTCTPGAGSWTLTLRNVSTGSLSEAPVFAFSIIKAVTS